MPRSLLLTLNAIALWLALTSVSIAQGVLDGRVFNGMIGPGENMNLADSLHFDGGYFWSDICTKCGFEPGVYATEDTDQGTVFRGVLKSKGRGTFTYEGLAKTDGTMEVLIKWERKRWYWTSKRDILFQGSEMTAHEGMTLEIIRAKMGGMDPSSNPLCARF